jgi:alkanesulfonate monooxygenase SsuD/methylene tetrahydromethanopterin reductase-like flavin-dependent oxidoreductase (luciferase family)
MTARGAVEVLPGRAQMAVRAFARSLRTRGALPTLARALVAPAILAGRALDGLRKRRVSRERLDFDAAYGLDTARTINLAELSIPSANWVYGTDYEAAPAEMLRDALAALDLDYSRFHFVDLGSGMGKALLVASDFAFRGITGVEFSPQLHATAQRNIASYRSASQRCFAIESVCSDVLDYTLPPEPSVFFMYNPFGEPVMSRLVERLRDSLARQPREVYVVYIYPRLERMLVDSGCLRILRRVEGCTIFVAHTPAYSRRPPRPAPPVLLCASPPPASQANQISGPRAGDGMKVYNFDLLSYPKLDPGSPRTPVPSSYFDPAAGAANYAEHIEEMAYCEALGFEGVVFNEHHYSAYGTMPSPNLIAAALSQRTNRMKIGVLGSILPLRNHPVRVAEEYAMLDCLTGGRLIAGFVRGVPAEYVWYNVDPEESRGRFEEAFDLIMTAWQEPVWSFKGKFFHLEDCALWPRPLQQPHPPVWVAARSAESIEWCVERHIPTAQVYQTTAQIEDTFGYYRQVAERNGWEAGAEQFVLCRHIFVGESDAGARRLAEPAIRYFFSLQARGFNEAINARAADQQRLREALNSARSFDYFREENRARIDFSTLGWDELIESGYLIAGSPESVRRQLGSQMTAAGAGHFMGMFHIGNLAHADVIASLERFRDEVMPALAE